MNRFKENYDLFWYGGVDKNDELRIFQKFDPIFVSSKFLYFRNHQNFIPKLILNNQSHVCKHTCFEKKQIYLAQSVNFDDFILLHFSLSSYMHLSFCKNVFIPLRTDILLLMHSKLLYISRGEVSLVVQSKIDCWAYGIF